jgi:hypothetical protein
LEEACCIFIGGPVDDAPNPSLEVVLFVGTDGTVAGGAGISEGQDVAAEFEFGQGDLGGKVAGVPFEDSILLWSLRSTLGSRRGLWTRRRGDGWLRRGRRKQVI